jgi:hypothetical protein
VSEISTYLEKVDALRAFAAGDRVDVKSVVLRMLWRSQRARELPLRLAEITLHLQNGGSLMGVPVHLEERDNVLTLASGGRETALTFVSLHSVVAVTVHDVERLRQPLPGVEVPQRLELLRKAKAVGDAAGVAVDVDVDEDAGRRLVILLLVERLEAVHKAIVVDAAGQQAWAALKRVRLATSKTETARDGEALVVGAVDVDAVPTAARLQGAIEKLL